MTANEIESDLELQRVLWACYKYWQGEPSLPHERVICYNWVLGLYEDRFDAKFHQSKLLLLTKLGFLKQDDTSRGGHRRYYKIIDPDRVDDLLRKWNLS
jgi:hypothetical protein